MIIYVKARCFAANKLWAFVLHAIMNQFTIISIAQIFHVDRRFPYKVFFILRIAQKFDITFIVNKEALDLAQFAFDASDIFAIDHIVEINIVGAPIILSGYTVHHYPAVCTAVLKIIRCFSADSSHIPD